MAECRYWEDMLGRTLKYPYMNLVDVSQSKKRSQERPQLVPLELLAIKSGQLFSAGTQYADQVRACGARSSARAPQAAQAHRSCGRIA